MFRIQTVGRLIQQHLRKALLANSCKYLSTVSYLNNCYSEHAPYQNRRLLNSKFTLSQTSQSRSGSVIGGQTPVFFCKFIRQNHTVIAMDLTWRPPVPAAAGNTMKDVQTPALLVDIANCEYNLKHMAKTMEKYPTVAVRPHAKAHKCPAVAKLQVEHGCVGVCTQTLTETEAMVYGGGTDDVLLSNECIGKAKIQRLVTLAKKGATVSVCVDEVDNVRDISEVAAEMDANIDLVVEVNVGQERCGVEPGQPAAKLAKYILGLPNVHFKGIQCYMGWNQHIRKPEDRKTATDKVVELTKDTIKALKAAGIDCPYVTGGGTGTYLYEAASGVFTEVQPGSYVFMDVDYWHNTSENGGKFDDYKHSLFVLTTVQSVCSPRRAVVDAGMKAVSLDSGVPIVSEQRDLIYSNGGDEHGILNPAGDLKVGQLLHLIPGHCDPTVNLYDWIVAVQDEKVKAVWPVLGRGPGV